MIWLTLSYKGPYPHIPMSKIPTNITTEQEIRFKPCCSFRSRIPRNV